MRALGTSLSGGELWHPGSAAPRPAGAAELELFGGGAPGELGLGAGAAFGRLAHAWRAGRADEAAQLAGELALREDPGPPLRRLEALLRAAGGRLRYAAADAAEAGVLGIALRLALMYLEGAPREGGLGAEEARGARQRLAALGPGVPVWVHSARALRETPAAARSGVHDEVQLRSFPPPVGLIPNQNALCYASAVLTLLLSITPLVRALEALRGPPAPREARGPPGLPWARQRRPLGAAGVPGVPGVPGGAGAEPVLGTLLGYAWHLESGEYGAERVGALHAELLGAPEMEGFRHGGADDALHFAEALLRLLGRLGLGGFFGEVLRIPDLVDAGTVALYPGAADAPAPPSLARGAFVERRGADGAEWSYDPAAPAHAPEPGRREALLYRLRGGPVIGTFEGVVRGVAKGPLPPVLLIAHQISVRDRPARMLPPCTLRLGRTYSLHGAVLHDMEHTGGHYISMVCSNTSMYFYDPQHDPGSEDPRTYRPRLLCYVEVPE